MNIINEMKTLVIINESHKILKEQEEILNERFSEYELLKVPSEGWTKKEMDDMISKWHFKIFDQTIKFVFISPIPYLINVLSIKEGFNNGEDDNYEKCEQIVYIFHNDNRIKKEINGKLISVISETGWQLL